jgi:glycerol-3-phosphate acyltransferase PlsY
VGLLLFALVSGADGLRTGFAAAVALFLVYTHRSNLARLRAGTEPRSERMRILGRLFSRKGT